MASQSTPIAYDNPIPVTIEKKVEDESNNNSNENTNREESQSGKVSKPDFIFFVCTIVANNQL